MPFTYFFIYYLIITIVGVGIEIIFSNLYYRFTGSTYKKNHFYFGRYIFLISLPALAFLVITNQLGYSPLVVFTVFAVLGTVFEGLVGFAYHKIVGQRLWTYHRYSINGYTSLLGSPIWGLLGILTWLLAKSF